MFLMACKASENLSQGFPAIIYNIIFTEHLRAVSIKMIKAAFSIITLKNHSSIAIKCRLAD
jgi:hypothetical protein